MSETLDEVLAVMKKPGNKFVRALDIIAAVITVLSLLSIVDIVKKWVFGG